jgi:hypothetical protein
LAVLRVLEGDAGMFQGRGAAQNLVEGFQGLLQTKGLAKALANLIENLDLEFWEGGFHN